MTNTVPPAPPDFNHRVEQYVKLRDKIKEVKARHEEELKPYNEAKEALEVYVLQWLQALNLEHAATAAGTAYLSTRVSATVKDMSAFWDFVRTNQLFDLVDKRANAPAVTEYIQKNGAPPPGVNYTTMLSLGVRRS
jgi:hypothetical protein